MIENRKNPLPDKNNTDNTKILSDYLFDQSTPKEKDISENKIILCAMRLLKTRSHMSEYLKQSPLHDGDWVMLLELFVSGQNDTTYVKQLTLASAESSTAAMRRIDRLESEGLISRQPDHQDRRRVIVQLSEQGYAAVKMLLQNIFGTYPQVEEAIG